MANSGKLDGGRELAEVTNKDGRAGSLFQKIIDAVNYHANSTGASPTGEIPPPKPPDSVAVKVAGEHIHIAINHSGPIQRNIRYFTEIHTDPAFGQPLVIDHGSSRTGPPHVLPTYLDDGVTKATYYVRSYAQYPGSQPSAPTVVGGIGSPTPFQMTGSTALSLLPSNGSGTGPNNGQSAGQGLGKVVNTVGQSQLGPSPVKTPGTAGVSYTVNGV